MDDGELARLVPVLPVKPAPTSGDDGSAGGLPIPIVVAGSALLVLLAVGYLAFRRGGGRVA